MNRAAPRRRNPGVGRWIATAVGCVLVLAVCHDGRASGLPASDDRFVIPEGLLPTDSSPEVLIRMLLVGDHHVAKAGTVTIDYPHEASIFPPEIVAPTLLWHDTAGHSTAWLIEVAFESESRRLLALTDGRLEAPQIDWRVVTDTNTYSPTDYQVSHPLSSGTRGKLRALSETHRYRAGARRRHGSNDCAVGFYRSLTTLIQTEL